MANQPQDQPEQPEKKRQRKAKGRSNGEGSVFKRSDSTRTKPWVAQITLDTGKKTVVGYYKTEAEAIAARNKALRDVQQGIWVENSKQTMGEYLNYWLEHVHKSILEITTYESYRGVLDNRIIPTFGHIQVQKLT
ncbi:MAG TPA: N-terminal phage integrase SAM-like domain-containing protein, partial [Ktedonobacteraceae bacterium]|nr:N-terminal phage integrase SAM-like domain-containing protein [Ktedonobacteraceae bacterium]